MIVEFWGTRSGLPLAASPVRRFGGNTASISVRIAKGEFLLLDCGTGAVEFSASAPAKNIQRTSAIFSSFSWDRMQGLPFFAPIFLPNFQLDCYALGDIEEALRYQMRYEHFPIPFFLLPCSKGFRNLEGTTGPIDIADGSAKLETLCLHPHRPLAAFSLNIKGKKLVYAVHIDWKDPYPSLNSLGDFGHGADLFICNLPSPNYYAAFKQLYEQIFPARIVCSDFSPTCEDEHIEATLKRLREFLSLEPESSALQAAYPGMRIDL